jgi:hypothetical protein
MKTTKWIKHTFESSIYKTPEFMQFARDFRSDINTMLKGSDWKLHKMDTGHFYLSGFFKNTLTGNFVYFSCSDVRFFRNQWASNLLVRDAEHDKDWTGGMNRSTRFCDLRDKLDNWPLFMVQ